MEHMRITNSFLNDNVLKNLFTNRNKMVDLQTQIASGKKIDKPSDDIFSAITIMTNNSALGRVDGYIENIKNAKTELEMVDNSLSSAVDSVHKARELTIQSLNATSGVEQMNIIKQEIDRILEGIRDIGNTKIGNNFIYGGKVTNTAPFVTTGTPGEIQYVGSPDGSHERSTEIAENVTISHNISGEEVFGYYYDDGGTLMEKGVIATLTRLSKELGSASPDKNNIRAELTSLESDLSNLLNVKSKIGSMAARLEISEKNHEESKITFTKFKSEAEDIDFAKVISDLNMQEATLQASLQIGARVIQPSLLNFI